MFAVPGAFGFGNENNIVGHTVGPMSDKILVPQRAHSLEAVVGTRIKDAVAVDGSVFFQQIDDQIEFLTYGSNFVARNAGQARYIGGELSARGGVGRVSGRLAGSYMHKLDAKDSVIPFFPQFQILSGFDVRIPELYLRPAALVRIAGERGASAGNTLLNNLKYYTLPAYGDFDILLSTMGVKLLGKEETVFSFGVRNVLDSRHSEPGAGGGFDLPTRGRTFGLEIRQSL
jgi:hypothetical protein